MAQSADDALEDTRQEPLSHSVGDEKLPEDNDRPAAPADDPDLKLQKNHPLTDSNIDPAVAYNSGRAGDYEQGQ